MWGNSKCKRPGAGTSLVSWRNSEEVRVAAMDGARERVRTNGSER